MTLARLMVLWSFLWLLIVGGAECQNGLKREQNGGSRVRAEQNPIEQTQAEEPSSQRRLRASPLLPPPGIRSFTGRVLKIGGHYLLEDALLGTTYDIDPQAAVSSFEGMTVRLNGALDSRGKILRLEPAPHSW